MALIIYSVDFTRWCYTKIVLTRRISAITKRINLVYKKVHSEKKLWDGWKANKLEVWNTVLQGIVSLMGSK